MEEIKLSKKGNALIKLYEEMAAKGIDMVDGARKDIVYNDFQLRKFRHICKHQISNEQIKTVLDYGIKIVSTSEIMVYYEVSPGCNCNPDIFALKGRNSLGNFFITPFQSFNNSGSDYFAGFSIFLFS